MTDSLCVFCGTSRRASVALCPTCGRPWIDQTPAEAIVAPPLIRRGDETIAPAAPDEAAAVMPPLPRPTPPPNRTPWFIAAAVVLVAVAIYVLTFGMWISGSADEDPTAGVPVPPITPTPTTAPPTTTTLPPTTTTSSTTTTTTTTTPLPLIPAAGESVPLEELTLGAFALGPFEFGKTNDQALGRLVRTFGQPDDIIAADEEWGLCSNDEGRVIRFGWLNAIFEDRGEDAVLIGYRVGEPEGGTLHPTARLTTVSGARVGDTLDKLRDIYIDSNVRTVEPPDGPGFILVRSGDLRTLLWGPLSDTTDSGQVEGIYSPRSCDGGPPAP